MFRRAGKSMSRKVSAFRPRLDSLESRELMAADFWMTRAEMLTPRTATAITTLPGGEPVVIGGINGTASTQAISKVVTSYDPSLNQWSYMPQLPEALAGAGVGTGLGGDILVMGGRQDDNVGSNNLYSYSLAAQRWTELAPMLTGVEFPGTATLSQNRVIVIGGKTAASGVVIDNVQIYDANRDQWYIAAPLPSPRTNIEAVTLPDGRVLAMGGRDAAGNTVAEVDIYDPVSNTWTAGVDLPAARELGGATVLGDGSVVYAGGNQATTGVVLQTYDTVYRFNSETNTWSTTTALPQATGSLGLVAAGNHSAYAIGGQLTSGNFTGDTSLFAVPGTQEEKLVNVQNFVNRIYQDTTGFLPNDQQFLRATTGLFSGSLTTKQLADNLLQTDAGTNWTVNGIYETVLGRNANRFELAQWQKQVQAGIVTPYQIKQYLLYSGEFYDQAGGTNADYVSALSTTLTGEDNAAENAKYVTELDNGVPTQIVSAQWMMLRKSVEYQINEFSIEYTGAELTTNQMNNSLKRIYAGGFGPFGVRNLILGSRNYWNIAKA